MPHVLVFGDLSLDVVVNLSASLPKHPFEGSDVTVVSAPLLQLGGTALLFARAVQSVATPHVIGCVGDDAAGESVRALLAGTGLDHRLHTTSEGPTSLINVIYSMSGDRLMVRSTATANKLLPSEFTVSCMDKSLRYRCVFVSGYLLTTPDSPVVAALREVANRVREEGTLVVLDCVPHEFLEHVGTLKDVERLIGPVDGVVMELRTAAQLGYTSVGETTAEALREAAGKLGDEVQLAVVQGRTGARTYSQAFQFRGETELLDYPCDPERMLGLGDQLLVDAMLKVGLLA